MAARDAKREVDFLKSLEKKEIIGEAKICKRAKSMACGVCGLVKTSTEADKGFWISSNKIYGAYNGYIPICIILKKHSGFKTSSFKFSR